MNYPLHIIILDESPDTLSHLEHLFKKSRCLASFQQAATYEQFVRYLEQKPPDAVLISTMLEQWDTRTIFPICHATSDTLTIIIINGPDDTRQAVEWMKAGADDYLTVAECERLPDILSDSRKDRTGRAAQLNGSENALKFYQMVIDSMPLQVGVYNVDGRYCYINVAAVTSSEMRQWLIGKTDFDYCREQNLSMAIAEQRHDAIKRCIAEQKTVEIEESFPTHHEGNRYITRFLSPVFDHTGSVIHVIGSSIDITESRRLEAQLQYAQKLESLGVLAGGIAHDFNNLLTVMLGHAELIKSQMSPDSRLYDNVQRIIRSSHRAAGLCQQMLAYAGKGKLVTKPCPLNAILMDIREFLDVSVSKQVRLQYRPASASPVIEGDPSQIHQVIINLVTNASEAIGDHEGVVTISTGAMSCDEAYLRKTYVDDDLLEGLYAYIEISDTGIGMDEAARQVLFDPFYTTKFMGRGLGLAAVLGIVRSHHGAITITSEPQKGSAIRVLFPAIEGEEWAEQDEPLPEPAWTSSGTVLVVDDEESMLVMTRLMMERMGFTVLTAVDGIEAVEVFGHHAEEIVLILLDITMPRLNGDDAFWELRKIRSDIPILLLSGYGEQILSGQLFEAGRADFIHKPYGMADLIEKMQALLA